MSNDSPPLHPRRNIIQVALGEKKPITAMFDDFMVKSSLASKRRFTPNEEQEMKRLFFTGAACALDLSRATAMIEDEDVAVAKLQALQDEIVEFAQTLAMNVAFRLVMPPSSNTPH